MIAFKISEYLNIKMKSNHVLFATDPRHNTTTVFTTDTNGRIIGGGGYCFIRKMINKNLRKMFHGLKDHEIMYNHTKNTFWIHESFWLRYN